MKRYWKYSCAINNILIIFLLILYNGCAHKETIEIVVGMTDYSTDGLETGMNKVSHVYTFLKNDELTPSDYAVYTYILLNRNKNDRESWQRYRKLVEEIISSTIEDDKHYFDYDKSLYNLFIFSYSDKKMLYDDVDKDWEKSLLSSIAASTTDKDLRNSVGNNPGPFLITTLEPIDRILYKKELDLLYVDLTKTNANAMPEVVSAYKGHVSEISIKGVKKFESIKLSLLNYILNLSDSIKIVSIVYEGSLE